MDIGIVVVPVRVCIVQVHPVKCAALAICTYMQVQPAQLQGQQTNAHKGDEQCWCCTHAIEDTR